MKTTHKLELQQAGSGDHFNGRCTCGNWHCYPGRWHDSKKRIREGFRLHVADEKERAKKERVHQRKDIAWGEAAEARACPKKNPAADIGRDVETACSKLRRIAKELRAAGKHVKSPEFKTADDIEDVIALLEGDHLIPVI